MKKLFAMVALLALSGFGCVKTPPVAVEAKPIAYNNAEFGFGFDYAEHDEMRERPADVRADTYLNRPADFFASLRDNKRAGEEKPVNLAYFYAIKDMKPAQFKQALLESGDNVAVKSMEPATVNSVTFTKVVSTTDLGIDKIHYLLERNGTLLVFSVFICEDQNFEDILKTFRVK